MAENIEIECDIIMSTNNSDNTIKTKILTDNIFLFKVSDYTTIILGRFNEQERYYYVERGDGTKYKYEEDRIMWKQKLEFKK